MIVLREDPAVVARRDAYTARLRATRDAARAAAGLPSLAPYEAPAARVPAFPAPSAPAPVAPPPPPDPALVEFERVRSAALARIAAEERAAAEALAARQAARAAEDRAVDSVFAAMAKAEGRSTEAESDPTVRAVLDAKRLHSPL